MHRWYIFSIICFFTSILFFILAALSGELHIGFIVIIPIIIGSGFYAFIGFLLIFLSFIFFFIGRISLNIPTNSMNKKETPQTQKNIQTGGVILIGPIPIIFGSTWKVALLFGGIGILLLLLMIYMYYLQ